MTKTDTYDQDLAELADALKACGLSQAEAGRRAGLRGNYASTRMHKLLKGKEKSRPLLRKLRVIVAAETASAEVSQ